MQRPTGKINLIGLVLILGVVAFIYSVVMFSKPILDNLDVKEQINAAYNQAQGLDDLQLKRLIEYQLVRVGEHDQDDGYGNIKTVPGLGLTDDNITVERDTVADTLLIRVDYARKVVLSPTNKVYWMQFHPQFSGPIIHR
ncbi:MAG TPA: hypothetical protein VH208_09915 [Myxococcaceae bacterium]|nr:hypothetical protein [Myxococcaceae bacterium]